MIVVELTAATTASGETQTFYFANQSYCTRPADTPSDTVFMPRLEDPGAVSISIYSGGADNIAGGSAKLEVGEIVLSNNDGGLDFMTPYSFDGREIVMRVGEGSSYPQHFPVVMRATVESVEINWNQMIVSVRDATYIFEKPILTQRFLGNNVLPNGLEGTADDIKDQIIPDLLGVGQNVAPPCVNTSKQTYRIKNGPVDDISAVFIRGASQTRSTDHANSTSLQAATISPGTYQTCLVEGLLRVGVNAVDGQLTANAEEGAIQGRSAARMLHRLALRAGVPDDSINLQDVADLDAANGTPISRYITGEDTYIDVMDEIARSVGAWFGFDTTGQLRMGRLNSPIGLPLDTIVERQIETEGMKRIVLPEMPTPLWSVTVNHTPIWQVQDTDLVGSVTLDRRAFLRNQFRSATYKEDAIKNQFRLAGSLTIDSLLYDPSGTAATNEATRKQQLHNEPQDVFEVPVKFDTATDLINAGMWLGSEIAVDVPRFGLAGGKSFIVIGINIQRRARVVVLRLWADATRHVLPFAEGAGSSSGFGAALGALQTASGVAASRGVAQGFGNINAQGFSPGPPVTLAGAGRPMGLLLAILTPAQTSDAGAGIASGTGTATGLPGWRGTASGVGNALGNGAVA